jgi:hypothetical protein
MQASVFGRAAVMTRPLWFITGFMCFFSIVIALAKVLQNIWCVQKVFRMKRLRTAGQSQ